MSLHNSRAAEMDMKSSPRLMLYVVFLFFSLKSHVSLAADRITANQSLSGDQTIVSSGGIFELGFFKPGNSSIYYIGIWYNGVPELTSVWVANRETPVSDRFAGWSIREKQQLKQGRMVIDSSRLLPCAAANKKQLQSQQWSLSSAPIISTSAMDQSRQQQQPQSSRSSSRSSSYSSKQHEDRWHQPQQQPINSLY